MASAAVGSCFSTASAIAPKLATYDGGAIRVYCPRQYCRNLPLTIFLQESLFLPITAQKRRLPRFTLASVVQEEAALSAEEEAKEEEALVEKEEEGEEAKEEEAAAASGFPTQNTKLYFGNLPYNCDSAHLAGIIQEYASPEMVEVLYDRETGRSRGFAFVTMSTVEDCEAVIDNLDGSQYGGRTLRVSFSDKPKPKTPLYPETQFKLFVGNLSWSVTSESLTEMFKEHGDVVGARVLFDGDTGRSRGYGFVCYSTKEEMENALEYLNGVELEGRELRISLALGRKS